MFSFHHVHVKSPDPHKTAQWYVDNFGASILLQAELFGAPLVAIQLGGVRINISGLAPGQKLPPGSAKPHLGIEHFALQTDDVRGVISKLEAKGVEILQQPILNERGATISFIKAPDNVRIEIAQLPA